MNTFEQLLFFIAVLILGSTVASKATGKFGVPALLVFLILGMAAGIEGFGKIAFSDFRLAQELGILALIFILFSGGMDTKLNSLRAVFLPALNLSTLGVVIATVSVGFFSFQFLNLSLLEGCILGAAVASTDVAAVFTLLRSKSVSLKGRVGPLLELESALNDPMAVFLSVGLLATLTQKNQSILGLIPLFFQQMIFGVLVGLGCGKLSAFIINRIRLEFEGLYPVFTIGWVLLTYVITQFIGGSGFLAVYIVGIILGNTNLLHKRSLIHFHEGIAWLMQIIMFITMGLLVKPSELLRLAPQGIALAAFAVFIARPLSVFICFPGRSFSFREKIVVSWAGLRGAVPIILSTYILIAGIPHAMTIFNLVFFVTFASVLLQGSTIPHIANWLNMSTPQAEKVNFPIEFNPKEDVRNKLLEVLIQPGARVSGRTILQLSLPSDVLVVLIHRAGQNVVPHGNTKILAKDTLLIVAGTEKTEEIKRLLQ